MTKQQCENNTFFSEGCNDALSLYEIKEIPHLMSTYESDQSEGEDENHHCIFDDDDENIHDASSSLTGPFALNPHRRIKSVGSSTVEFLKNKLDMKGAKDDIDFPLMTLEFLDDPNVSRPSIPGLQEVSENKHILSLRSLEASRKELEREKEQSYEHQQDSFSTSDLGSLSPRSIFRTNKTPSSHSLPLSNKDDSPSSPGRHPLERSNLRKQRVNFDQDTSMHRRIRSHDSYKMYLRRSPRRNIVNRYLSEDKSNFRPRHLRDISELTAPAIMSIPEDSNCNIPLCRSFDLEVDSPHSNRSRYDMQAPPPTRRFNTNIFVSKNPSKGKLAPPILNKSFSGGSHTADTVCTSDDTIQNTVRRSTSKLRKIRKTFTNISLCNRPLDTSSKLSSTHPAGIVFSAYGGGEDEPNLEIPQNFEEHDTPKKKRTESHKRHKSDGSIMYNMHIPNVYKIWNRKRKGQSLS